jgi:diaminopimelate decarboxylase
MIDSCPREMLMEITRRHGTPAYAFDVRTLRSQVRKLQSTIPREVEILYSLKANASLGICDIFARTGIGADVASAGELATAVEAGFPSDKIFVAGPFKLSETISQLRQLPDAIVSVDSPSEFHSLAEQQLRNRIVLRLRPDFGSEAVVTAGRESRFGFTADDLRRFRPVVESTGVDVIGFHVFAGSQVMHAEKAIAHLRGAFDLSRRAADGLGITPRLFNLGGGFGIPYAACDQELDLRPIADQLAKMVDLARPVRLVLELGRYLVAQSGWYLTTVLGHQDHQGRLAVVVDGGTHQRADMCGLCLRSKAKPPVVLDGETSGITPTDVLGCLSLPADVMAESSLLPRLSPGQVLAFANAGAYGLWSSPAMFHGSPLPAELAFDETNIYVMRERQPARSILAGQRHVSFQ